MRRFFLPLVFLSAILFSTAVFAQTESVQITGGKFTITGRSNEQPQNATITGDNFSATGHLGGLLSPWWDICGGTPDICRFGKTVFAPRMTNIDLGGCVGDCNQFIAGRFVLNGNVYENVYYQGYFNFTRNSFFIPRFLRRKGSVNLREHFKLDGRLEVCKVSSIERPCPPEEILFDKYVYGHGTLTFRSEIKNYDSGTQIYPYLSQKSFDYEFEP